MSSVSQPRSSINLSECAVSLIMVEDIGSYLAHDVRNVFDEDIQQSVVIVIEEESAFAVIPGQSDADSRVVTYVIPGGISTSFVKQVISRGVGASLKGGLGD